MHEIEKKDDIVTAWDTFTKDTPGQSLRYELDGKTVFDIPDLLKDWNIYLAQTRVEQDFICLWIASGVGVLKVSLSSWKQKQRSGLQRYFV